MGLGSEAGGGGCTCRGGRCCGGTGSPGGSATCGTSELPVCVGGGCGITCVLEEEDGADLLGGTGVVIALLSCGAFLVGESLLFSLAGLSSSEELDELELELELELEDSDSGVSGSWDGCGGGC